MNTNLSRRTFFGMAAAATAAAAVPILTESQLAFAQRRRIARDIPPGAVRIDANENPLGPCSGACATMASLIPEGGRYDFELTQKLIDTFSAAEGLKPDYVLAYAGSSEPLHYSVLAFTSKDRSYVTADPGYEAGMYAAKVSGANIVKVPLAKDYSHDVRAMIAADPNAGVFYICNPNNPTGTMLETTAIDKFLANIPAHVVVVLDEAYYEFAVHFATLRKLQYSRSLEYLQRGANVIVLRTFSKAHGLAGVRVGYGLGPAELLGYCARMRNTFSVSSVAQAAALAALDDHPHIQSVVENNAIQSRDLSQGLLALGYGVVPTSANFVFCDLREDAANYADRLHKESIAVRPLGSWGAPNCIRVTIGRPEQNRAFLRAASVLKSDAENRSASR